jgi:hypothetical protein
MPLERLRIASCLPRLAMNHSDRAECIDQTVTECRGRLETWMKDRAECIDPMTVDRFATWMKDRAECIEQMTVNHDRFATWRKGLLVPMLLPGRFASLESSLPANRN